MSPAWFGGTGAIYVCEPRGVVILSDDFACLRGKYYFRVNTIHRLHRYFSAHRDDSCLRDESHIFSDLNGLRAAFGAELVEEPARVGLDGVFADEEFVGDLAIAQAVSD